jgi:hypothetical protein
MIFGRKWFGKGRSYAHQIGGEKGDLNLGIVPAVEDDSLFGFGETNDRADLLQLGDVLRRSESSETKNTNRNS